MEITEKLRKLQELTGNEFSFNEVNLEGEFDPQEHDQLMQVRVILCEYVVFLHQLWLLVFQPMPGFFVLTWNLICNDFP